MLLDVTLKGNKLLITEQNEDLEVNHKICKNFRPSFGISTHKQTEWKSLVGNKNINYIVKDSPIEYYESISEKEKTKDIVIYNNIAPEYQYIRDNYKTNNIFKSRYWFIDIETGIPENGGFPNPQEAEAPVTLMTIYESDTQKKFVFGFLRDYNPITNDVKYFKADTESEMLRLFFEYVETRNPSILLAWNGDGFDYPYIVNRLKIYYKNSYKKIISLFNHTYNNRAFIFGKEMNIEKPTGRIWLDYIECFKKSDPSGKESWSLEYISKYVLGDVGGKLQYNQRGYKSMKNFILNEYDPDLDIEENSKLKKYYLSKQTEKFEQEYYNLFVEYGVQDVELLGLMDEKLKLLDMIITLANTMKCNVKDVFGTIKPWTTFIYNTLYDRKIALPSKALYPNRQYGGGWVSANPKFHKWVVSEDYTSLYPFIMLQLGLSPETFIEHENIPLELKPLIEDFYLKTDCEDIYENLSLDKKLKIKEILQQNNMSMGVNGSCYNNSIDGIIPELIKRIYKERKHHKTIMKEMEIKSINESDKEKSDYYKDISEKEDINQYVRKILMNSLYGAIGNKYFVLFNPDIADAITSYGRYSIKTTTGYVINNINKKMNGDYVDIVLQDTDSFYLNLDKVVEKWEETKSEAQSENDVVNFVDSFDKKIIQPLITKKTETNFKLLNGKELSLKMDREKIGSVICTGKKRYAFKVYDNEGIRYKKPKISYTGLEIKRSSTPSLIREKLSEVIDIIFNKDNEYLLNYVEEFRNNYLNKQFTIDEISIPVGVSDIEKFVYAPLFRKLTKFSNNKFKKMLLDMKDYSVTNGGLLASLLDEVDDNEYKDLFQQKRVELINKEELKKIIENNENLFRDTTGIPIHVRSSLVHNKFINDYNLKNEFDIIRSGDKIKWLYLEQNGITDSNVVGFNDSNILHTKQNLEELIDYNLMFEKTFITPLNTLIDSIGWEKDLNRIDCDLF